MTVYLFHFPDTGVSSEKTYINIHIYIYNQLFETFTGALVALVVPPQEMHLMPRSALKAKKHPLSEGRKMLVEIMCGLMYNFGGGSETRTVFCKS